MSGPTSPHKESEPWKTDVTQCTKFSPPEEIKPGGDSAVFGLSGQPAVAILDDSQLLVRRLAGRPLMPVQKGFFAVDFCHVVPSSCAGPGSCTHTYRDGNRLLDLHNVTNTFPPKPPAKTWFICLLIVY